MKSTILGCHKFASPHPREPVGFTVVELLVSIGIIGLLVAVTLPAVQSAREAAQRMDCSSRMKQVSLAVLQYHDTHRAYPNNGFRYSILPELGYAEIYHARLSTTPQGHSYDPIWNAQIPVYRCPSDGPGAAIPGAANIAGCFGAGTLNYGFNGFFASTVGQTSMWPSTWIRDRDIQNGHSNVAMLSEMLIGISDPNLILRTNYTTPLSYSPNDLEGLCDYCSQIPDHPVAFGYRGISIVRGTSWFDPSLGHAHYNHAMGPNRQSCLNRSHLATGVYSATSSHRGGVNVAYADGHVSFASNSIDRDVWRRIGSRVDRNVAQ